MDLSFANPAGFWALLGLPAIVLIHFLQRRARPQIITTLFLLDLQRQESAGGHRFQRLRTSLPFWLQLLMVLGLTWLLVEPRWLRSQSVQRVAVVLDQSASMQAFRKRAVAALASRLNSLGSVAATIEYTMLVTVPDAPRLYHGSSLTEMITALDHWKPWLGTHDATDSLRAARSAVGKDGLVILLTDHPPSGPLPYGVQHLAVGEPIPNVGWTGVSIEQMENMSVIKAMVRNFSASAQSRRWWIESPDGRRSEAAMLELEAGQSRLLESSLPPETDRFVLALDHDTFTADDRVPLVRPAPKTISVSLPAGEGPAQRIFRELFEAFPHTRIAASPREAVLTVAGYDPLSPSLPEGSACVFAADPQPGATFLTGLILAEPTALMDGLNWQGLLVRDTLPIPRAPQDRVHVWQNERPLVTERLSPSGQRQLLFNFDLQTSNARKLPAFAIVLHRFLEQLRADLIAPEAIVAQTGQKLHVARRTGPEAPPLRLRVDPLTQADSTTGPGGPRAVPSGPAESVVAQPSLLRAPIEPGFFELVQGAETHLRGAAHFVDPRESDFSAAAEGDSLAEVRPVLVERHSEADAHWRLWTLAVLATLMVSWYFTRE